MARTIQDLLADFDEIMGGEEKTASVKTSSADEVDALVAELRAPKAFDHQVVGGRFGQAESQPFWEKVAESLAFAETIANLPQLQKIAAFEERALEKGFSEAQISEFFQKSAAANRYRSIIDVIFS